MMERRTFVLGLSGAGLLARAATAQVLRPRDGRALFRVAIFAISIDMAPGGILFELLREALASLGYREGINLEFIVSIQEQQNGRTLAELARDLVERAPDVIVVSTTPNAVAARDATRMIPIVTVSVGDPVGVGLIDSPSRPGRNVTGVTNNQFELLGKQVALLKDVVPGVGPVGFMMNTQNPLHPRWMEAVRDLPGRLGIEALPLLYSVADEFDELIDRAAQERIGAIVVVSDGLAYAYRDTIFRAALRNRLPTISAFKVDAVAGGLLAYGTYSADLNRRAATYVDRILRGGDPATMPVEFPSRFQFVINLKTAHALSLHIR